MSVATTWGTTAEERARAFPCDEHAPSGARAAYRGVDVAAPPAVVFRWLCQMRVAPYSYDWIDNLGRRSPPVLTPGLEQLEVGQTVMTIFDLVSFERDDQSERDRHVTLRLKPGGVGQRMFGALWVSYVVLPRGAGGARLLAKLAVPRRPGLVSALAYHALMWGDLVMMRRQLLNLARLAEASVGAEAD